MGRRLAQVICPEICSLRIGRDAATDVNRQRAPSADADLHGLWMQLGSAVALLTDSVRRPSLRSPESGVLISSLPSVC
ncbi:unnamed protein product [Vitrella brassicaformis CCMP3155]|uniref:Uncharacterized protein n=1 Tax=Vitrella brassicaformis (strain CCMP3155) TaxID=1169540 RepID=A0A0G4EZR4_VITBC|nr:unnamed protein product [Vitrella brassicaformis CCMP3155]|eukprot:CEM04638.1 unnamed protein product [Vitrella brassicaformis CCMP3155]